MWHHCSHGIVGESPGLRSWEDAGSLTVPPEVGMALGRDVPWFPRICPYLSSTMENCSRPDSGSAPDTGIDKGTQSLTSLLTHCLQIKGYFPSLHSVKYGFNQLQQQKNHTIGYYYYFFFSFHAWITSKGSTYWPVRPSKVQTSRWKTGSFWPKHWPTSIISHAGRVLTDAQMDCVLLPGA